MTNALNGVTRYEYDKMGRLVQEFTPMNFETKMEYDDLGRLVKSVDHEGNVTEYDYDALGQLLKKTNADKTFVEYAYNANGWLTDVWNEDGAVLSYGFDKNGNITLTTDAMGYSTAYKYNRLNRLTSVTDALDGVTSYKYDNNGNLIEVIDALNGKTTYQYDVRNLVTSVTDPLNNVTKLEYDENRNISKAINADGGVTTFVYDLLDQLISYTDPEGYTFSAVYDANGNLIQSTDGRGNSKSFSFDALNHLIGVADENNFASTIVYDADGRIVSFTNNEGATTDYEYDKNGNTTKATDALGNATTFTYDAMDRVSTMINSRGAVTAYEYTPIGNVAKITDALDGIKTYEYDILGRLIKSANENGEATEYTHDALGRVLSVKNPLGHSDKFTYDALGRITTVTDKNGNVTKYVYDANGNITETIDAFDNSSYFEYDSMDRLVKTTLYRIDDRHSVNEAQITLYKYDKRGLVTMEINAMEDSTIYVYDGNGNLVQKTDADGYVTEYGYDPKNLVEAINYSGNITTSPLAVTATMSGNDVTIAVRDNAIVLATKVVPFMKNTTQTYDVAGYTVEIVYNGGGVKSASIIGGSGSSTSGKEVQFAYNKNGELVAMMDWNGTVNFTLDILDRIISVNDQNEKITGYAYDEVSNKIKITYPDNTIAAYEFDLLDRITKLTDAEKQETAYQYDPASQLTAMGYPNDWDETYTYDAAGQMLTQLAKDPSDKVNKQILHTYEYDPEGNILHEYRSGAGGQTKYDYTHTYDALNRLTKTTGLWGYKDRIYEYDSLGNLVYEKNANVSNGAKDGNEYWYNNLNQQVTKKVDDKDIYSYTYDKRGNLVKGVYNKKLSDPSKDEVKEQYVYDGTNRMVKGTNEKGEESHYIYNGLGYLVANEWIIEKNAYGYTGVDAPASPQVNGVVVCDRHQNTTGQGHINPTGKGHTTGGTTGGVLPKIDNKKFIVVHKDYMLDYTDPLKNTLVETESGAGGLAYRYTYGLEKASVVIYGIPNGDGSVVQKFEYPSGKENVVKFYYHHDHLGSTDYLTNNINGKVESYTEYDDWGHLMMKTIIKLGVRELDLVTGYTGHPFDQVLGVYYARARMYDAAGRRFMAMDPIKSVDSMIHYREYFDKETETVYLHSRYYDPSVGRFTKEDPARAQTNWYIYCLNNPIVRIDPWGLDSYIFYLTEWENEALSDKQDLIDMGLTEGEIILILLTSADDLTNGWNGMGTRANGDACSIDYVIINTHGDPAGLYGGNDPFTFTTGNIAALDDKSMKGLVLYGCNAGNLDYWGTNPAQAFARKVNGAPVIASDGTVYGKNGAGEYGSRNDNFFQALSPSGRDNRGWVMYQYTGQNGPNVLTRPMDFKSLSVPNAINWINNYKENFHNLWLQRMAPYIIN
jgi:RHS repeat-associated protein